MGKPIYLTSDQQVDKTETNNFPTKSQFQKTIKNLKTALSIQSISYDVGHQNVSGFKAWKKFIENEYSDIFTNSENIEFKWFHHSALMLYLKPKKNLENILPPIGFIAHCDVVPVTKEKWDSDPFDPDYSDPKLDKDYVYPDLDDKNLQSKIYKKREFYYNKIPEAEQYENYNDINCKISMNMNMNKP
mgnify:CR=1 FL=1